MAAAWSRAGLQGLSLPRSSQEEARLALAGKLNKCLSNLPFPTQPRTAEEAVLEEEILRYLAKERVHFSTRIDFSGYTAFQKRVLEVVRAIPYGETRTYGEVALQANRSKGAARAIGGVMRINRTPIVIPCHRVIAAGGLGGYSGGLEVKKCLLQLEGSLPSLHYLR